MTAVIRNAVGAAAIVGALIAAPLAYGQSYPVKSVRLIVPFPPGGGTDFFARTVGAKMSAILGQPIVIENRPGAGTIIGAEATAKATPDGYTVLLGDSATFATNVSLRRNLPYDPQRDFAPVTLTGRFALLLVVSPALMNVSSVKALVDLARKEPGKLDYASPPPGGPHHLAMELFKQRTGVDMVAVHFQGAAPAMQELLAGRLPVMFLDLAAGQAQIKGGKLKALAVASDQRIAALPDLPTIAESGVPGFEASAWQGLVVPAGTPEHVIAKLNGAYSTAIQDSALREKIVAAGIDPLFSTPAEFAAHMRNEIAKWAQLIKERHITLE